MTIIYNMGESKSLWEAVTKRAVSTVFTSDQCWTVLVSLLDNNPSYVTGIVSSIDHAERDTERVQRELSRIHLPNLQHRGYIEWVPESGLVIRGPKFEEIRSLAEHLRGGREAVVVGG